MNSRRARAFSERRALAEARGKTLAGDGGLFSLPTIGHKSHAEGRAGAADGAMNANCSFVAMLSLSVL